MEGVEPSPMGLEAIVLPLNYIPASALRTVIVVWEAGFEPATTPFQTEYSDQTELFPES